MKKLFLLLSVIGFNIFSLNRFTNLATRFEQQKKEQKNYFENQQHWKKNKKGNFKNIFLKQGKQTFGFKQGCPKGNKKY